MIRGIAWLEQKADHEWHIPVAEAAGFDVVVVDLATNPRSACVSASDVGSERVPTAYNAETATSYSVFSLRPPKYLPSLPSFADSYKKVTYGVKILTEWLKMAYMQLSGHLHDCFGRQ